MAEIRTSMVSTNGIEMRIRETGEGPLVILCHGFPQLGYSWRHQMAPLAEAGYRVVAPDQRGYGGTDQPEDPAAYTLCHMAGDMVGLVHALGEDRAAIVGHDWGAPVAWTSALLRPDIFGALGLLSVPYLPEMWTGPPPTAAMRMMPPGQTFYQVYFQEPGKADAELARDVRESYLRMLHGASGGPASGQGWRPVLFEGEGFLDTLPPAEGLPPWLTETEFNGYVDEFSRTGFTGGLNWYRNLDRSRELLGFLAGATIRQPSLFVAGAEDTVIAIYRGAYDSMEHSMPKLAMKELIPGAGHWVQEEKPAEVTRYLLDFLNSAWPVS